MSTLTSLAKARAYELGKAVRTATHRHAHISDRPLAFVPLQMAGEANAPLACLIGTAPENPTLLVVPQPRNRDLRFAFAAQLAEIVVPYVDSHTAILDTDGRAAVFRDAPQVVVANPGGIEFTRLFGRSTRFRRVDGEYPVAPMVPLLGRWLTWLAESTERPGSSTMLALTTVLSDHWATGQSALEDANLAALMGWIDPWDGLTGPLAAAQAEDPSIWPPAGPATDPDFDNTVLAELIRTYDAADDDAARASATVKISDALRTQLDPTWRLMWRALDLLRALAPASTVEQRWLKDRRGFTRIVEYWRDGGFPQAKVDHAVRAAQRLDWLERDLDEFTVDRAFDDPLAMAEFRLSGEAFAGTVMWTNPTRVDGTGRRRKLRPHIGVLTNDPVRLEVGSTVRAATRPNQRGTVVAVDPAPLPPGVSMPDFYMPVLVTVELAGGMGNSLTAPPGTVPEANEAICYSSLAKSPAIQSKFPKREDTPWTHGGPPQPYESDEFGGAAGSTEDAQEAWS